MSMEFIKNETHMRVEKSMDIIKTFGTKLLYGNKNGQFVALRYEFISS